MLEYFWARGWQKGEVEISCFIPLSKQLLFSFFHQRRKGSQRKIKMMLEMENVCFDLEVIAIASRMEMSLSIKKVIY